MVSPTSWGEGVSLALFDHASIGGVTLKIPYGIDVLLHRRDLDPIFSYWAGSKINLNH